jgi:hypothetical protein
VARARSELSEQVRRSFASEAEAGFAPRYLDVLRENIRDAQLHAARVFALLALCVVAFFLLLKSDNGQITVFGITLKDVPLPTQMLPALIAYLIFALYNTGEYVLRMRRLLRAVFRETYPALSSAGLDWAFVPRSTIAPLSELGEYLDSDPSRPVTINRLTAAAYLLVPALTFCLSAGFVVYCYVALWNASPATVAGRSGGPVDLVNGVYWISVAIAAVYLSRTALSPNLRRLFWDGLKAIRRQEPGASLRPTP